MQDLRQTPEYAKYLESLGWKIEKINNNFYFLKKILFWYVLKIQRPKQFNNEAIQQLTNKYRIWKIYLEPLEKISDFKQSRNFFLPTKTIQISLAQPLEKIFSNLHQKTRYNIKLALKKKFKIINSSDIDLFVDLWSKNREGFFGNFISLKNSIKNIQKAFDKKSNLLFAVVDGQVVSGLLILESSDTAYYMYAFSTQIGNKLFAPTLLTWTAIENAKKKKLKIFDFDGVYDHRFPLNSWQGFTKFKQGFGGREIEYPGCFEKIMWRNLFKVFL